MKPAPTDRLSVYNLQLYCSFYNGLSNQYNNSFKKTHSFSLSTPVTWKCQKIPYLFTLSSSYIHFKTSSKLNINQIAEGSSIPVLRRRIFQTMFATIYSVLSLAIQMPQNPEILVVFDSKCLWYQINVENHKSN